MTLVTDSLLNQGFSLLIYGVSVVFLFLTVLVILTTLMSKIILKFFPEPVAAPAAPKRASASSTQTDAEVTTAISAAIHKFRNDHKRK